MKLLTKVVFVISAFLLFSNSFAATAEQSNKPIMIPAGTVIANLETGLQAVKAKSDLPILFPKQIPVASTDQKYYFSSDSSINNNNQYILNIDSTTTCNGMKGCNVGSIVARVGGQVGPQSTGSNLTETLQLANGQTAYYTPAHAAGDYWPTTIQWKSGNIAYYFSWMMNQPTWNQKNIMIKLANSAIKNQ